MKIDVRATTTSEGKQISRTTLGRALTDALFSGKKIQKPHNKWVKRSVTIEFYSRNPDGMRELQVSNLTISETGRAGMHDSTDGVSLLKFIKNLRGLT